MSAPLPQTSSGLVGSRPGSSSAVSRSIVAGARSANGTASRSATSATSTRSAPESCTVASPRPPAGRGRRPIANVSRVSVSSERSKQRCTPYAANSASQPASEPAMAPEWASTRAWPRTDEPTVRATTGMSRAAASASPAWSPAASRIVSSTSPTTRVSGSDERIGQVVGRRTDQLLPGGDDDGVVQPTVGAQHRREHRPRVRHQRDRPDGHRLALEVADRAHPGGEVDEAHAAAAHQRHLAGGRDHVLLHAVRRPVDDGAGVTAGRGDLERRRQRRVGDAQQHQVDRLRHVGQGRDAGPAQHLPPGRVHEMDAGQPGAPQHLGRHPPAERVGPVAGADDGHRPGAHHRPQAGRRSGRHRPGGPCTRSPALAGHATDTGPRCPRSTTVAP